MATLVFDIETIGEDFDLLDETTQHMLTRWVERDARDEAEYERGVEDIKNGLGFSPLTGEVVVIGVLDTEKNKGVVYYQAPGQVNEEFEEGGMLFKQRTEKEMLEQFWQGANRYDEFVTFNGRSFDVPFLMIRSAVHKIKPSKNLLANRYLNYQYQAAARHVDLCDQLSFYGAVRRRPSLHLVSRALGIKSPKGEGVTGDDVSRLFKEKRFVDIAKYNVGDLVATAEVYRYWRDYLNVS